MADERVVVVGAGAISGAWFPALIAEGVEAAAVVDLNTEAARRRIEEFELDAEVSDDLEGTLARVKPDFVVDLTVPEAHCGVTCTALAAGCHVIGEKPMASSMEEARQMVAAAERTERLYMVSQNRRWNPHHEAARRVVAEERIGALTTVNCDFYIGAHFRGFRTRMPSPLILDMAIHHFDLARYMAGTDALAVYAHEFNPAGSWYEGDAAASCIFEMGDGVVFTYRGSWCAEGCQTSWNGDWRFVGDRGTMLVEGDERPRGELVTEKEGFRRELEPLAVPEPTIEHTSQRGALREMLEFLRTGRTPQTECHDNIKSLAMVFAAMRSSRESRRVEVEAGATR